MIDFSRSSWHRRVHDAVYSCDPPPSLCPYFWRVVCAVVLWPLYMVTLCTDKQALTPQTKYSRLPYLLFDAFMGVLVWCYAAVIGWILYLAATTPTFALALVSLLGLFAVIVAVIVAVGVAWHRWRAKSPKPTAAPETDGLVISFWRATRKRLCPFINWID